MLIATDCKLVYNNGVKGSLHDERFYIKTYRFYMGKFALPWNFILIKPPSIKQCENEIIFLQFIHTIRREKNGNSIRFIRAVAKVNRAQDYESVKAKFLIHNPFLIRNFLSNFLKQTQNDNHPSHGSAIQKKSEEFQIRFNINAFYGIEIVGTSEFTTRKIKK